MDFRQFLNKFPLFLKTGFSDKTPINRDRKLYNSVTSVESIKLLTIIEEKIGHNGCTYVCSQYDVYGRV